MRDKVAHYLNMARLYRGSASELWAEGNLLKMLAGKHVMSPAGRQLFKASAREFIELARAARRDVRRLP